MCGQLELTSTNLTKISATSSKTSSSGQHTTNRKFICQFTSARCAFREHTAITPPWGSACRLSGLLLAAATPHALLPLPLHFHYTAITPPLHSFAQTLEDFGSFRAVWCMPWEAYLKILKRMFRRCNWKSAPYTVAKDWATKSVMHYRDASRASWHENQVEASSEHYYNLEPLVKTSALVRHLVAHSSPVSIRYLHCVTRGRDEVRVRDWILLRESDKPNRVAYLAQMVQVQNRGCMHSVIRMWCTNARNVQTAEDATLVTCSSPVSMIVKFECMHVTVVTACGTRDGCDVYI